MNKYTPLFIWLLVCFIFVIIKSGCSPPAPSPQPETCCIGQTEHTCGMPGMDDLPITYNIVDNNNLAHRYKEDIFNLNLPLDNPKLTQFCLLHTNWERITVMYQGGAEGYVVNRITP